MKAIQLDFEYNDTSEEFYNLVCCSAILYPENIAYNFWLHKDPYDQEKLVKFLVDHSDRVMFCWNGMAEGSAVYSLRLNPTRFKWIDLYTEFRMLANHNNRIACGKHYIDGKEVIIPPPKPKWMREEGEEGAKKLTFSLPQGVYKFLGKKIDTDRKEKMRQLIISKPNDFSRTERAEIMAYCESDTIYLGQLYEKMLEEYKKVIPREELPSLTQEMLLRGENTVRAAIIERGGYTIDVEATRNFSDSVPFILSDFQRDINSQFKDIRPFNFNRPKKAYSMNQNGLKDWIVSQNLDHKWMRTATKELSLALEAWTKYFDYKHDYPRGNLGAQIVRYLKTKQSLSGFMPPKKDKKSFWDYVGRDGVVRPYLNPYGSQSSRFQPSATSFLFLKSAWMRSLAVPPKGKMYVGIDYKSEEFLIKGITFLDKPMIKAYQTGDPYLAFAKDIKLVPKDATKKSHPAERNSSKSSILGISYDMTKIGLAVKLTADTGRVHTEEEAQQWIDDFNTAYIDQHLGSKAYVQDYRESGYAKLLDGWYMFGDNGNDRSVGNFPHQGMGAVILRRVIKYCQEAKINFTIPLHDAGYILCDIGDWSTVDKFAEIMKQAFKDSFPKEYQKYADVFLDIEAWSPEFLVEDEVLTPKRNKVKVERIHKDERDLKNYAQFSRYFGAPDWKEL